MKKLRNISIKIKNKIREGILILQDESGLSVIEMLLILVVIVALVMIFKTQLLQMVETIFEKIADESARI